MTDPRVIARVEGTAGTILLNRPEALNAQDLGMVEAIVEALERFRDDPAVRLVILEGAGGRAFCAGGDIRAVREAVLAGDAAPAERFFALEYALCGTIARFPKPWISLIDGICMGGGVGLSVHGSHRVVTEAATVAMPETAIGFFPDIGSSHVLPRLPGAIGNWLGLTGARLRGAEAVEAGLATHFCARDALPALRQALLSGDAEAVEAHCRPVRPGAVAATREAIERCFAVGTLPRIVAALEGENSDWSRAQLAALRRCSPTALSVTREMLRRGAAWDLDTALQHELALARRMIRHPDFSEGVRALLVERGDQPRWQPATLEEVDAEAIRAALSDHPAEA
ncbi:enoyl-CoA hydratase/isomerase family protein [Roseomonas elaeocarpi]|uniref:3-hydroxyisobutyryl-CoA hydrolase n=1 Tax=Roseomonas elaeocarpi TaxID=907779 RepID=A0ABV6JRX2_9PROT